MIQIIKRTCVVCGEQFTSVKSRRDPRLPNYCSMCRFKKVQDSKPEIPARWRRKKPPTA